MNPTEIPIRNDMNPGFHPNAIHGGLEEREALSVEGTPGHRAYTAGRDAAATLYGSMGKLLDAEKLIASGTEAEVARAAAPVYQRAAETLERGLTSITAERTRIQTTLDEAFSAEPRNGTEIRLHLSRLDPADRLGLVIRRIRAGDRDTGLAVLSAPPFLSGIEDERIAELRALAERSWFPQEAAQRAAIDKMTETLQRAAQSMAEVHRRILDRYRKAEDARKAAADKATDVLRKLNEGT